MLFEIIIAHEKSIIIYLVQHELFQGRSKTNNLIKYTSHNIFLNDGVKF